MTLTPEQQVLYDEIVSRVGEARGDHAAVAYHRAGNDPADLEARQGGHLGPPPAHI